MASPLRSLLLLLAVLAVAWAASSKQGMRLVGGLTEANVNETGVLDALNFAMSEYNKGNNDAYHSRAIQVVKAHKQVRVSAVPLLSGGSGPLPPRNLVKGSGPLQSLFLSPPPCVSSTDLPLVYSGTQKSTAGGHQPS